MGGSRELCLLHYMMASAVLPAVLAYSGHLLAGPVQTWEPPMCGLFSLSLPSPIPYNPGLCSGTPAPHCW